MNVFELTRALIDIESISNNEVTVHLKNDLLHGYLWQVES